MHIGSVQLTHSLGIISVWGGWLSLAVLPVRGGHCAVRTTAEVRCAAAARGGHVTVEVWSSGEGESW